MVFVTRDLHILNCLNYNRYLRLTFAERGNYNNLYTRAACVIIKFIALLLASILGAICDAGLYAFNNWYK